MIPVKKSSLKDLVYQQIKLMISNKDLLPGDKVNRKQLAQLLGVSQTPVQDAIVRLIQEGLFEDKKSNGIYVRVFTNKDMQDIFALRAGIEGIALRLCISKGCEEIEDLFKLFDSFTVPMTDSEEIARYQKIDRMFHEQIITRSGNELMKNFVKDFSFILRCYHKGLLRHPNETLPEHLAIIQAAREKNPEKAQNLLIAHHMASYERLSDL